jgi:hypothetical protein
LKLGLQYAALHQTRLLLFGAEQLQGWALAVFSMAP